MGIETFSDRKRELFLKVKEVKRLRGGVAIYAAKLFRIEKFDSLCAAPWAKGQGWPRVTSKRVD
ncbi:MAG: hypothetical protein BA869_06265 [Desulfuromonadales bacterium C00003107]|jgi:hypothetical protein|nr:MAG: hypothetical protein BA869_06265 [Desulfuromonadales bacterium C00003107]